ncbi:hypothetical protein K488DRAFT_80704 [Vararia minispora EC-137]|uniref:Uncharacterized protein n=1 Tax=Vararia minispora EC-137 TaxID=1314806 RepID=A0ACB8Q9S5_9AGAM|nr:hypothetical protein K488DRAFT_80704 [Vararia minispora EC-137]
MLRNVARLVTRRGMHTARATAAAAPSRRSALILGASATVAGYMAWQLASDARKIAADASSECTRGGSPSPTAGLTPKALDVSASEAYASKPVHERGEVRTFDKEGADEVSKRDGGEGEEGDPSQQAAFDPATGKINWDCPCLGGMAYGPCGQQFRQAFSCFVFSEQEPKGIDCVDAFKAMQQCFRDHPEVYGEEILGQDDDEDEDSLAPTPTDAPAPAPGPVPAPLPAASKPASSSKESH